MKLFKLIFAVLFFAQAFGLGELLHAENDTCAAACAGHNDEAPQPQADHEAGCQWHCMNCSFHVIQVERQAKALFPLDPASKDQEEPFLFVPAAPCASIFHPPA